MAALPYIQLYVADYLADTTHLSTEEHGAYLLLIMNYWQRGKPLPNNDSRLALVARLSNERWTDVKQTLSEFFNVTETEWKHERIDRDLERVNSKSSSASMAGKASAEARKAKKETEFQRTFNERSNECSVDVATDAQRKVNHTYTYTNTDTDTNTKTDKNIKEKDITPAALRAPEKTTKKKKQATSIPENFSVSESVMVWYVKADYKENINEHLVSFIDKAIAKGYTYVDWDSALRNAIREDWAGLRKGKAQQTANQQKGDWSDQYWKNYKVLG